MRGVRESNQALATCPSQVAGAVIATSVQNHVRNYENDDGPPPMRVTETFGPSEVIWVHPPEAPRCE